MNQTVIPISPDTWRIEDGHVRFFLLAGTEKALLIDSGLNSPDARGIAEGLTDLPLSLLNTHADPDHISGNAAFDSFYMHPDEEPNYRRHGGTGTLIPVREGDMLDLGKRELRIIHLPGHTPGSIAVLEPKRRVVYSGDPVQRNGRIFLFGAHRNMERYIESLSHLEAYKDEFDELRPSHGDIPLPPSVLPLLREGAERVLNGEVPGRPETVHGSPVTVYDLGFTVILGEPL
jgi:Zn-dependent hydrolases, including glyoxylases